ncbi:MAG: hypothetical protein WD847_08285 [Pirellulales bacterium]
MDCSNGLARSQSAVYESRPIKRKRRSKAEITAVRDQLYQIIAENKPCTCRQVFYLASVAEIVPKTQAAYKGTVVRLLGRMRRDGQLPFDWIGDNTRWQRKPNTHWSMEDALYETAKYYRRDLWRSQDAYVEIWIEKDALAGVVYEITEKWDVPLMVSKGFSSISYLYSAAEAIKDAGKPAYLYYFGDHDPSGVHIDRKIESDLRTFAPDCEIHFKRVAVKAEQIKSLKLPTRPTKKTDSRAKSFKGDSVEVDAIPPKALKTMVETCIVQHIDHEVVRRLKSVEDAERETLLRFANIDPERLKEIAEELDL